MRSTPLDSDCFPSSAAVPGLTDARFRRVKCSVAPPNVPSLRFRWSNILSLTTPRAARDHETHLCKCNFAVFSLSFQCASVTKDTSTFVPLYGLNAPLFLSISLPCYFYFMTIISLFSFFISLFYVVTLVLPASHQEYRFWD